MKKIPFRKCIGCMESKPKFELLRVVKQKDGKIIIDRTGNSEGRGAYICYNESCLDYAIKKRRLEREFSIQVSDEVCDALRKEIRGANC